MNLDLPCKGEELVLGFYRANFPAREWLDVSEKITNLDTGYVWKTIRLIVPSTVARDFEVRLLDGRVVPAWQFQETENWQDDCPPSYGLPPMRRGDVATLRVRNVSDSAKTFQAALVGCREVTQ